MRCYQAVGSLLFTLLGLNAAERVGDVIGTATPGGAVLVTGVCASAPARDAGWCAQHVVVARATGSSVQWEPWTVSDSQQVHRYRLLDPAFVRRLVTAVDQTPARLWTKKRHHVHPTHDLPISRMSLATELYDTLKQSVLPVIAGLYRVSPESLSLRDTFCVKYTAAAEGGQPGLEMHADGADFSFNIALSHSETFEGGGTKFEILNNSTVNIDPGDCIIHASELMHGGVDISSGQRLILVGFVKRRIVDQLLRVDASELA